MKLDIEKKMTSGKKPYYVISIWERTHTDCYRAYTTKELEVIFYNKEVNELMRTPIQDYVNVYAPFKELRALKFEYKPQKIKVEINEKDYERIAYIDTTKVKQEKIIFKSIRKR